MKSIENFGSGIKEYGLWLGPNLYVLFLVLITYGLGKGFNFVFLGLAFSLILLFYFFENNFFNKLTNYDFKTFFKLIISFFVSFFIYLVLLKLLKYDDFFLPLIISMIFIIPVYSIFLIGYFFLVLYNKFKEF